jgi:hypothetical protein
LRVFQLNAGDSRFGATMGSGPADAPAFIKQVIANLNAGNSAGQTFDDLPVEQDASPLELAQQVNGTAVFNFALAKVRYRGTIDISNVRVFFRLFPAATTSTAYDQTTTYRRGSHGGITIPLLGISAKGELVTIPCFAEARIDSASSSLTTQADPANVQTIKHNAGGAEVAAYFGCWLDINQTQPQFPLQPSPPDGPWASGRRTIQELIRNVHQCLVAEIAFDPDPIPAAASPASSDKLAQRNLTIVGTASPHRIPLTFDFKSTVTPVPPNQAPDELLIEWGNLPLGSQAEIYLPGTSADAILNLATRLYGNHGLASSDAHTLTCTAAGITYVPIPPSIQAHLAGLLTVDVPETVQQGQLFKVVVRQVTRAVGTPPPPVISVATTAAAQETPEWRRIVGSFQLSVPVKTREDFLGPEERLLSVLLWVGQTIPQTNRWYPVFQRYLDQIAGRVQDLGGDPSLILPSPSGSGRIRPVVRKRVVLKIWLHDGVLTDNAYEIEWLERNGWRVVHSEKLLEDPRSGTCEILYLLERDKNSFAADDYPPPVGGGVMKPISVTVPAAHHPHVKTATQIILTCSATRGRILVRQLDPLSSSNDAVIAPAPAAHSPALAAGVVVTSITRAEPEPGTCLIGIFCINDSDPYSPPRDKQDTKGYPEAPHAVIRVDAFFAGESITLAQGGPIPIVNNELVPAGEMRAFYVQFVTRAREAPD